MKAQAEPIRVAPANPERSNPGPRNGREAAIGEGTNLNPDLILAWQQAAGNAAVSGVVTARRRLGEGAVVQRCGDHQAAGCPCSGVLEDNEGLSRPDGGSIIDRVNEERHSVQRAAPAPGTPSPRTHETGRTERSTPVQRYSFDEFTNDLTALGAAAGDAAEAAFAAFESEPAAQEALSTARALVASTGGTVSLSGTAVHVDIPEIPLLDADQTPLVDIPVPPLRLPFLGGGAAVGPLILEADLALEVALRPEVLAVLGPASVRGIHLVIDPIGGSYTATGQLHVAGSASTIISLEPGLDLEAMAILVVGEAAIQVEVDAFGGLRLAVRGTGLGSVDETVTLGYRAGSLFLDSLTDLKLGARFDAELDATLEINVEQQPVCEYTWPFKQWLLAENAEQYTLPLTLSYGPGGPGYTVGPVSSRPIPVDDIEAVMPTLPSTKDCTSLDRLIALLCAKGVIPPELCRRPGHGGGPSFAGATGIHGAGGGGSAGSFRTRYQLQSGRINIDSVPRSRPTSITVAEGHEDIDTLLSRQGKVINSACADAAAKMKKTVAGYPPAGVSARGNVARKWCDEVDSYEKPVRLDLENLDGTNYKT